MNLQKTTGSIKSLYRGWWIVAAIFFANTFVIGSAQYSFGFFVKPIGDEFGWSRTIISASLSFYAASSVLAPILGRFLDKYSIRFLMSGGLAIIAVSFIFRILMTEPWHWFLLSFLQFAPSFIASEGSMGKLIANWFPEIRGRVMGFAAMGNNMGGLFLAPIAGLIIGFFSWRIGYLYIGIFGIIASVFVVLVVRDRPNNLHKESRELNKTVSSSMHKDWEIKDLIRTKRFFAVAGIVLIGVLTYDIILVNITTHLVIEGFSTEMASIALAVLAILGMISKALFGYISEKISARISLIIILIGQSGLIFVMTSIPFNYVLITSAAMYGIFMGGWGVVYQLFVQENYGIKNYGSILGTIVVFTGIAHLIGPILAGITFDISQSYKLIFTIVAVLFLLAAVILYRIPKAKEN